MSGCLSQADRNFKIGRPWGSVTAETGVFQGGERALTLAAVASALWDGGKHAPSKQGSAQKPLSNESFSSSWGRRPVVAQKPLMNPFCPKLASQHNGGMIFRNEEESGLLIFTALQLLQSQTASVMAKPKMTQRSKRMHDEKFVQEPFEETIHRGSEDYSLSCVEIMIKGTWPLEFKSSSVGGDRIWLENDF